ncbi:MAG: flagellar hook-associated protein FlgK [Acetobacteraceae bacterium]|nr:flagellar hook-associated protein FlgK [Acetobacteraceae bacterium]
MRASFFGLETALRALLAHQRAIDVAGHNVANASTDGYSRQRVVLSPGTAYPEPGLWWPASATQVGTGVVVEDIRRLRDSFLDRQYCRAAADLAEWRARSSSLEQVEAIWNEPSEGGLAATLQRFWASLQALANDPESLAARAAARESAADLCLVINEVHRRLNEMRRSLDASVRERVDEINRLASEVQGLNREILRIRGQGGQANDLEDRRQLLVDRLAEVAGARALPQAGGSLLVLLGSAPLADAASWYPLEAQDDPANGFLARVAWKGGGTPADIEGGELKGLLDLRDSSLAAWIEAVEDMASALTDRLNAVHRAGFGLDGVDGRDFFDPAGGAGTMALSAAVAQDAGAIAASASGARGDGSNALALAGVRAEPLMAGATVDQFWAGLVSEVGVLGAAAEGRVSAGELLVAQVENQRQSLSGVSVDEEMVSLVRYQHGYEAAARLMAAHREILAILFEYLA